MKRTFKSYILPIVAAIIIVVAIIAVMTQTAADSSAIQDAQTAAPTPTQTPTPTPTIRPAYIPDPDELQQIPDLSTLNMTEGYINAAYDSESLLVSWKTNEKADYYLLCVLNEDGIILQKDILWGDLSQWQLYGYAGNSVLILAYNDMGEDSAEDDKLEGAYIKDIAPMDSGDETDGPVHIEGLNKYYIIVDKEDHAFAIFTYDENGEYTEKYAEYPCALGRSKRMTPTGTFEISSKGKWKAWKAGQYSPYYTRFTSGLYFHGAIYRAKRGNAMLRRSYEKIGQDETSGCIRTTMIGAKVVYYICPAGTVVEIVESSDLVSNPGLPPIDEENPGWDPTDPDKPQ